jgi:hypothetical protein
VDFVPVLRINQQRGDAPHRYRIEITATDIPNFAPLQFGRDIAFELTSQDGERIRWYLEDYLQFDEDPAPQIARGVEALMAECGDVLFRGLFEGTHQSIQLWTMIEPHLSATRVEITTGISEATAIPWELIHNPHTGTFLALSAASFVRTQRGAGTDWRSGEGSHPAGDLSAARWRGRAVSVRGRPAGDAAQRRCP